MMDLDSYLSTAIDNLVGSAIRICVKRPGMAGFFMRARSTLASAAKLRGKYSGEGLHIPPFLIASIASSCNLFCKGCYARANGSVCAGQSPENVHTGAAELDTGRWRDLFEQAQSLGVSFILLAGGEPLMRRDVVSLAVEFPNILFPVFTNGTMLDSETLRFFQKNRNLIPVLSIEGGRAETDGRRGEGVFDAVTGVMRSLESAGVFYGVSVTVTKSNLNTVTESRFIATLRSAGCSLVFYVEYVPVNGDEHDAPDDAERELLAQRLKELRQSAGMLLISFPGDEKLTGGCLAAGRGFFHISPTGNAEPCPFSPFSGISLKEHSLKEALDCSLFTKLRAGGLTELPHAGGCALWSKRAEVEELLK